MYRLLIAIKEYQSINKRWSNGQLKLHFDYLLLIKIAIFIFVIVLFILYRKRLLLGQNKNLKKLVDEKIKNFKEINKNLEQKIIIKIEKNKKQLNKFNIFYDLILRNSQYIYNIIKSTLKSSNVKLINEINYKNQIKTLKILYFTNKHQNKDISMGLDNIYNIVKKNLCKNRQDSAKFFIKISIKL
jgi:hypothetical protein